MNKYKFLLVVMLFIGSFGVVYSAQAQTPTLYVSSTGSSDAVQVTVNGDSNASVYLYYQRSGYGTQSYYLGTTNYNGYLYTTVNTSSLGINFNSSVYVTINNQQSSSVSWPYNSYNYNNNYYYGGGSIVLSPSSVTLNLGQTTNVTVSGGYAPYTLNSSNYNVVQSAIASNTLTVTGLTAGSTTVTVCSSSNYGCASLYITVNNQSNYVGSIYNPYQNNQYQYQNQNQYQDGWIYCASENQLCNVNGTQTMRYGANGRYYYKSVIGNVWCSNNTFGDPAYGMYKQCSYGGVAPLTSNYSNNYSYNAYTFTRALAYGYYGEDVKELQNRLRSEDFYSGISSGYFGTLTKAAVKRYQAARDLYQSGRLDNATMMALNNSY